MGKTAAERQRERRLRLKQDTRGYSKYLKRDRERKQTDRKSLSQRELNDLKERNRLAVKKFRSGPSVDSVEDFKYGSPAALGKAKCRVLKALPKSPRKRKTVLKAVACDVLDAYVVTPAHNRLPGETVNAVKAFYEDDSISRVMPGKADYISVRDVNGQKIKKQKRHLVMTVSEAYRVFQAEHPDVDIGRSRFCDLRPQWVLLSSDMPHNVCCCKYHENVFLLLEALHRKYPETVPLYSKEKFTSRCVCSVDDEDCMSNNCDVCSDATLFLERFRDVVDVDEECKWFQWCEINGYLQKVPTTGTSHEAFDELAAQLPKFLWHCFIKEKQALAYSNSKATAMQEESDVCLLQMDFAENFTCVSQDEIQSAHWKQRQVTVYTIMVYHRGNALSYVILSDSRDHDKCAVIAFTSHIFGIIASEMPAVQLVDIWTDGPSSQYKNKYVFSVVHKLEEVFGVRIRWNYFATSHGKGPNDALGGTVKRIGHRVIMTRAAVVTDAETLGQALKRSETKARIAVISEEAIRKSCQEIGVDEIWAGLQTFQGTISTHCFRSNGKDEIFANFYSSAAETRRLCVRRTGEAVASTANLTHSRPESPVAATSPPVPVSARSLPAQVAASSQPLSVVTRTQPPPVAARSQPPPVAARFQPPPVAARSQPPPVAARSQSPPVATRSQSPPVATRSQSPPVAVSSKPPVVATCSQPPPVSARSRIKKRPSKLYSQSYTCLYCGYYYGQETDPKSHDDWVTCMSCHKWVHETCAEDNGIIDDDEQFTCFNCLL